MAKWFFERVCAQLLMTGCAAGYLITLAACAPAIGDTGNQQAKAATSIGRSLEARVQETREAALAIAEEAKSLVDAITASDLGASYCMLPRDDPRRDSEVMEGVARLEAGLRERLARTLAARPTIDMAYLSYEHYILFGERQFATVDEREAWRSTSGGDMYAGPFAEWRRGDVVDSTKVDVQELASGTLVGVPVTFEGKYICALYFRFVER